MVDEAKIRAQVESRRNRVDVVVDEYTPGGKLRAAPIYSAQLTNQYLAKTATVKGKSVYEVELKTKEKLATWNEQEIRKRIAEAKADAKEQAQAEAERLDQEAKDILTEMQGLLAATLSIDDKIDWDAERDTREHAPFQFGAPPSAPELPEPALPKKPWWTWLVPGSKARWETKCAETVAAHSEALEQANAQWRQALQQHERARQQAEDAHGASVAEFVAKQEAFNAALVTFRRRFEEGDVETIAEYCLRVFERSQYPDSLIIRHEANFDPETNYVVVDVAFPPLSGTPSHAGYKFVAKGNRVAPVDLKKKEVEKLRTSIFDQVVLRTMHEVFESCYTPHVVGAIVNGWVTDINPATGLEERTHVRCISSDRSTFESLNLDRVEPAACVAKLSGNVNTLNASAQ